MGSKSLVKLFLDSGIDPNQTDRRIAPLFIATSSSKSDIEIIEILLKNGANPNVEDSFGRRLIDQIQWIPRPDIHSLLRKYGAKNEIFNQLDHLAD